MLSDAMTSQAHGDISPNEPSVVFNISQTEVEPEVLQLPYPPKLPLKRRVSESFLQTRGYLRKRKRTYGTLREAANDCPCLPPPTYDTSMTAPASNFNSAYSTLPTTPPTPDASHPRRPSQVAEIIGKVNARLRSLFGSRRGSDEDEHPPLNPTGTQRLSISDTLGGATENLRMQRHSEDLTGVGLSTLPNVSEYCDTNGEAGPISSHTTADWHTFQATLRAERRNTVQAQLDSDLHYDGDSDLEQLHRLQSRSMQTLRSEDRKRKDSQFSFSDFLKPRRFSKAEKGKGRMGSVSSSQDQLLNTHQETSDTAEPTMTDIETLPFLTAVHNAIYSPEQPVESSPRMDSVSSQSSTSVSPMEYDIPSRPKPAVRKVSVRLVPPTPMPSQVQRQSSTSSTASSSSVSSFGSPTPVTGPSRTVHQLARDIIRPPTTPGIETGANAHSQPISIPSSYPNPRHLSLSAEASARPINDSPTLPPSPTSSTTNLLRHGTRPDTDTNPSPLPLNPTSIPSLETMQTLHLGPPERALLQRSVSSTSSRIFHVSVEQFPLPAAMSTSTSTSTQPVSRFSVCSSLASGNSSAMQCGDNDEDVDMPDFSITHPAPPSPLVDDGGSPPLADVPSPVKRRTGSLEGSQDLRAVYIEQGKASVITGPPRQRSPRKSLQGRCWWDESPPKVYL